MTPSLFTIPGLAFATSTIAHGNETLGQLVPFFLFIAGTSLAIFVVGELIGIVFSASERSEREKKDEKKKYAEEHELLEEDLDEDGNEW
jgi:hypothetical protein